jgi:hypothetical protein
MRKNIAMFLIIIKVREIVQSNNIDGSGRALAPVVV